MTSSLLCSLLLGTAFELGAVATYGEDVRSVTVAEHPTQGPALAVTTREAVEVVSLAPEGPKRRALAKGEFTAPPVGSRPQMAFMDGSACVLAERRGDGTAEIVLIDARSGEATPLGKGQGALAADANSAASGALVWHEGELLRGASSVANGHIWQIPGAPCSACCSLGAASSLAHGGAVVAFGSSAGGKHGIWFTGGDKKPRRIGDAIEGSTIAAAAGEDGSIVLAWSASALSGEIHVARSAKGDSFSAPATVAKGNDPVLADLGKGRIALAFEDPDGGRIMAALSRDGGKAFAPPEVVDDPKVAISAFEVAIGPVPGGRSAWLAWVGLDEQGRKRAHARKIIARDPS